MIRNRIKFYLESSVELLGDVASPLLENGLPQSHSRLLLVILAVECLVNVQCQHLKMHSHLIETWSTLILIVKLKLASFNKTILTSVHNFL